MVASSTRKQSQPAAHTAPPPALELRVHGVHGTSPNSMLGVEAKQVAGDGLTGIYRAQGRPLPYRNLNAGQAVEAYSWGALTSGVQGFLGWVRRVLWLTLLPFAFVNVAYWARFHLDTSSETTGREAQNQRPVHPLGRAPSDLSLRVDPLPDLHRPHRLAVLRRQRERLSAAAGSDRLHDSLQCRPTDGHRVRCGPFAVLATLWALVAQHPSEVRSRSRDTDKISDMGPSQPLRSQSHVERRTCGARRLATPARGAWASARS